MGHALLLLLVLLPTPIIEIPPPYLCGVPVPGGTDFRQWAASGGKIRLTAINNVSLQ